MKRIIKRWVLAICIFLVFATFPLQARAEENGILSRSCEYTTTNRSREGLREIWDANSSSDYIVKGPGELIISWEDPTPAKRLYVEWKMLPKDFTITQYRKDGSVVKTAAGETYQLNQLYAISEDTRKISLSSQTDMDICTAVVYGPDTIPKDYHPWKATPAKLDYLMIVAHPDDDVIFMGAIVPTYGVERGLNGTIVYTCSSNIRYRCNEALNGAWAMGLRNHPIFADFPDILPSQREQRESLFTVKELTNYYVRIIRQYKPEVVISHDTEGEYGHWQHKYVAEAVCAAVSLAADDTYDPESVGQYGVFQVKKLYLHLYPENKIKLDVTSPLAAFGNKNIVEISNAAFQEHVSQADASHLNDSHDGVYSLSDYGLYFSSVGADQSGNDMFEHIDPESLSNYTSPTPFSSASLPDIPSAVSPAAATSCSASPSPELNINQKSAGWLFYLLIPLLAAAICAGVVRRISIMRKNRPSGRK